MVSDIKLTDNYLMQILKYILDLHSYSYPSLYFRPSNPGPKKKNSQTRLGKKKYDKIK